MEYFACFDLSPSFLPDETLLRKRYLQLSKRYHPDFHSLAPASVQQEMLESSTRLNEAYRTLSDFHARMEYILREEGYLGDNDRNALDPAFLQDMMEVNETLMELEFDYDPDTYRRIRTAVGEIEARERLAIQPYLSRYEDSGTERTAILQAVKDFFLKHKYVWRIQQKLDKFAAASDEKTT